ncbi:MAG: peptide-methionine (S)-S-oxide reductase [Spirochaetaceae bacterium]|nr:MAG: peptide-methionine (S)-S-oxide reductase [Spirochaetaceae bacterium]
MSGNTERATVGGGCFWCTEAVYQRLPGVISVKPGYAGGTTAAPTYEQVCSGTTGHAEVVQIEFDPSQLSYADVLQQFFAAHDPTTLNRQGADAGTQYRSVILYHDEQQRQVAERVKAAAAAQFRDPIVTEIVPLERFYPAEDYHHNYFNRNPNAGYCTVVIQPKLAKLGLTR